MDETRDKSSDGRMRHRISLRLSVRAVAASCNGSINGAKSASRGAGLPPAPTSQPTYLGMVTGGVPSFTVRTSDGEAGSRQHTTLSVSQEKWRFAKRSRLRSGQPGFAARAPGSTNPRYTVAKGVSNASLCLKHQLNEYQELGLRPE